ncbi:M15 family metallopeptidase [Bacillus sp. B15-48]|uniref:M15 family metallopeptidase n=1 Tax=Bacillus sp. B15-48 TaxID=1548601 RepID=UPI00193FFB8D|nr:M15 family metallopeptidase [Bacillus sp. B15-48]MBM4762003.1 D-alanyl-D-alanine carboxypeptidase family protein [Bacillus sp. B15-48]
MKNIVLVVFFTFLFLSGCSQQEIADKTPFLGETGLKQISPDETKIAGSDGIPGNDGPVLEAVYFNEVKPVDGKKVIQNPDNILVLVNRTYSLSADYIPSDLVRPNVPFSFGNQEVEKSLLREEAATALEEMFTAAEESGLELFAVSGYRSFSRQDQIHQAEVYNVGEGNAVEAVAVPGNSEHQTGLAMDISARSVGLRLTEELGETKEGKWLANNAHHFGFILRYPEGKEEITGYIYEPWHFRYVGRKAAKEIQQNNWTLEEYFEKVRKI